MFKELIVHASFGERTGYQIHASRFFPLLDKLVRDAKGTDGTVHISLLDSVSIQNVTERYPAPSILYNVWESTEQPAWFMNKLQYFDQLWVPSEWQRAASIAQGVPEEFVKVVPEGVDPDVYKPDGLLNVSLRGKEGAGTFNFVHVGQWQPRKSTEEIIRAFLNAFPIGPTYENVRLYLSVDTLFPSDKYKSTEERLAAYGLEDPRIIPVHFEERSDYIRRLQSAHCFVSCARSEGWGLPIIEAMACGVPTIVSDWGGSTEYHQGAITIPVKKLIKPFGIYGDWDVPGQWCEPDYEQLSKSMRDVYERYAFAKQNALALSDKIRDKYSWQRAAEKAFNELEQLHKSCVFVTKDLTKPEVISSSCPEDVVREFARKHGFTIESMRKEKTIFAVGTWPNSKEKMDTLIETITQIKQMGYPVMVTTHYPLPPNIVELADYVLYDKKNVLSGDWKSEYSRVFPDGRVETKRSRIEYHGVACLNAIRNAVDFCRAKYDRMFYLEYDCEVDMQKFIDEALSIDKPFAGIDYEGRGVRTDLWTGELSFLDKYIPVVDSWTDYIKDMDNVQNEYPLEFYLYNKFPQDKIGLIKFDTYNRFDQTDRELWDDDMFSINFFEGPCLNIGGISNRVYDVTYTVGDKNVYTVQQKVGMWSKADPKFYLPWKVTAILNGELKFEHTLDLTDKRVLIQFGSKALGDTIAWMPYVEEFRKQHKCHVICSGWWQEIFDYPEIEFIKPGTEVKDILAAYTVGCFDDQLDKNPVNWRDVSLQKVASDILGLEYRPLKAKLKSHDTDPMVMRRPDNKYVCFSEYSTMKNKLWNRPGAWQNIVDHLNGLGYSCISVSAEPSQLNNVIKHNGQSIQSTISDIMNCDFYIGLNHGPSWIAYALDKPVVMITGVSEPWNDFPNPFRIAINNDVCGVGCFNDKTLPIDRGWDWCPRHKDYVCTKDITEGMVTATISRLIEETFREVPNAAQKGKKQKGKHKGNGEGGLVK
jgi:autotransporter strand-loop-strand O-heptosyltransferase